MQRSQQARRRSRCSGHSGSPAQLRSTHSRRSWRSGLSYVRYHECGEGVMEVPWLMRNLARLRPVPRGGGGDMEVSGLRHYPALPRPVPRVRRGRQESVAADAQPCSSTPATRLLPKISLLSLTTSGDIERRDTSGPHHLHGPRVPVAHPRAGRAGEESLEGTWRGADARIWSRSIAPNGTGTLSRIFKFAEHGSEHTLQAALGDGFGIWEASPAGPSGDHVRGYRALSCSTRRATRGHAGAAGRRDRAFNAFTDPRLSLISCRSSFAGIRLPTTVTGRR